MSGHLPFKAKVTVPCALVCSVETIQIVQLFADTSAYNKDKEHLEHVATNGLGDTNGSTR